MDDLDRLKELAKKASSGPWMPDLDLDGTLRAEDGAPICVLSDHNETESNAEYIAAANPQAILSLIAKCEAERARREKAEQERDAEIGARAAWQSKADREKERRERAEAALLVIAKASKDSWADWVNNGYETTEPISFVEETEKQARAVLKENADD